MGQLKKMGVKFVDGSKKYYCAICNSEVIDLGGGWWKCTKPECPNSKPFQETLKKKKE